MSAMASQITGISIVCLNVCSGADQRKHQSSASPAFVRGIPRWPVDSPHKGPVMRKMFLFDDVIMNYVHYIRIVPRGQRPRLAGTAQSVLTYWLTLVASLEGQAVWKTQISLGGVVGRGPEGSPHKGPVMRKMFLFDDVIMNYVHYIRIVPRGQRPRLAGTAQSVLTYWLTLVASLEGQAVWKTQISLGGVVGRGPEGSTMHPPPPHPYKTMFFWTLRVSTIRNKMLTVKI